jgi:large repetitive protein
MGDRLDPDAFVPQAEFASGPRSDVDALRLRDTAGEKRAAVGDDNLPRGDDAAPETREAIEAEREPVAGSASDDDLFSGARRSAGGSDPAPVYAAGKASLPVEAASGLEDTAIALSIGASVSSGGGSDSLALRIEGVPSGAVLSAGTDNGDGSWSLAPAELVGLTLTPPANSDADFTLTVVATVTEASSGARSTTSALLPVTVTAVADTPAMTAGAASGTEDTAIALPLSAALTDTDGSESLTVVVSGVPAGAVLSAGTDNGDGSWTLTGASISGVTLTPPPGADGDFTLTIVATATEANGGDTAVTTATMAVSVAADADAPIVTVSGAPVPRTRRSR